MGVSHLPGFILCLAPNRGVGMCKVGTFSHLEKQCQRFSSFYNSENRYTFQFQQKTLFFSLYVSFYFT